MSHCAQPRIAPEIAVSAPITPTSSCASGDADHSGAKRAIRYTPAVTIVAAWISALTGVGPSIASGSHVCSGTCADFAAQPMNSPRQIRNSSCDESVAAARPKTSAYAIEPKRCTIRNTANMMPTSPTTFITNALRAAATADGRSNQKPIKK